jgi:DNA replicative helicase MCM subunit Mcm2 (Cdc46/Mcm family)
MQEDVAEFVEEMKEKEQKYLIEISPRFVIGIMRMCKALAKMQGRESVAKEDIRVVKEIVLDSLKLE